MLLLATGDQLVDGDRDTRPEVSHLGQGAVGRHRGPGEVESGLGPGEVSPPPAPGSVRLCLRAQAQLSGVTLTGGGRRRSNRGRICGVQHSGAPVVSLRLVLCLDPGVLSLRFGDLPRTAAPH